MPRSQRKPSGTGIYHIWIRGINRQRIFEEPSDYEQYLMILREVKELSGFTLFAYCLLDNHVHLLLKEGVEPLAQIFKRIGSRYVYWFNWKYQRSGHLFQDRFMSRPVESDNYFKAVLAYIYDNPLKAGLCTNAADYCWSSRRLLGAGGIVDEAALFEIVSYNEIVKLAQDADQKGILELENRYRPLADEAAAEMMRISFNIKSTAELQGLDRDQQTQVFSKLHAQGVSIRQFARLAGIGRRVVERMARPDSSW